MASDKVNYQEVGRTAQALKFQLRSGSAWNELPGATKESLDQIATAMARIACGFDGHHWDGIIAYANAAQASEPSAPTVVATMDLERNIRSLVDREIQIGMAMPHER